MAERILAMVTTSGRRLEVRVWPTPVPGLLVGEHPKGGWVIASENGQAAIGRYEDPEAALACALEIGPLAEWGTAGDGQIRVPLDVIMKVNEIVLRWGGGEIAIKPRPGV